MTAGTARASSPTRSRPARTASSTRRRARRRTIVGFQPCFGAVGTGGGQGSCPTNGSLVNEGRDEALEFAAGNFGLVESAYDYGKDVTPPATTLDTDGVTQSRSPINYRFTMDNEPSVIHYTTDGSTPTLASPTYNAQRARSVGEVLTISDAGPPRSSGSRSTSRATSRRSSPRRSCSTQTAPTITTNIADGAVYTQGQPGPAHVLVRG